MKLYCFFLILLISCNIEQDDMIGIYVFNSTNVNDTLILKKDKYIRKIYCNGKIIFNNTSNWKLKDNNIQLNSFLINDNDINCNHIYNNNELMYCSFPIRNNVIIVNPNTYSNYKKIEKK